VYFTMKQTERAILTELVDSFRFDKHIAYDLPMQHCHAGIATIEEVSYLKHMLRYNRLAVLRMLATSPQARQKVEKQLKVLSDLLAKKVHQLYEMYLIAA